MMKNAVYFTSKALFVFKIIKFLSWRFVPLAKPLEWKDKVNLKFYDIEDWLNNNCNIHTTQYIEKQRKSDNEIWSVNRI